MSVAFPATGAMPPSGSVLKNSAAPTPWTLPSNQYAAVRRDLDYATVVDTETGQRIIELINEMHMTGKTIVLVTHEEEFARAAQRVIHMRDGHLVGTAVR